MFLKKVFCNHQNLSFQSLESSWLLPQLFLNTEFCLWKIKLILDVVKGEPVDGHSMKAC